MSAAPTRSSEAMSVAATDHDFATSSAGSVDSNAATSLRRASMILTVATAGASASNYLLNLVLARWMPADVFGDANLIVTMMLGITAVAITLQLVAAHRSSVSTPEAVSVFRRVLVRRAAGLGAVGCAVFSAASPLLRDSTSSASAVPFVVLAIGLPSYLALAVERGVLQGRLQFRQLAATLLIEATVRLAVAVALVIAGFGVAGATAGITASFVASWWWGRRSVLGARAVAFACSSTASQDGRTLAIGATVTLLVGQIAINNGDVVLAKAMFDAETAGVYAVVALVGRAVFFLSWSVVAAAFPLAARGDGAAVRREAVRTVAVLCAVMTVAVALLAPMLAPVVFGAGYEAAGSLFGPYALATSLFAVANVYATLSAARGRSIVARVVVGGAVLQTVLLTQAADAQQMVTLQVVAMGLLLIATVAADRRSDRE